MNTCPTLTTFASLVQEFRDPSLVDMLAPITQKLEGTLATPEVEQARAFFFADRAVRYFAPMVLDSTESRDPGFFFRPKQEAGRLRDLPEIVDEKTAQEAYRAAERAAQRCADAIANWSGRRSRKGRPGWDPPTYRWYDYSMPKFGRVLFSRDTTKEAASAASASCMYHRPAGWTFTSEDGSKCADFAFGSAVRAANLRLCTVEQVVQVLSEACEIR